MTDFPIRTATSADIPELVRLKGQTMLGWPIEVDLDSDPTWRDRAAAEIARQMAGGDFVAYVVDAPERSDVGTPGGRLAGSIFASLERHIPGPGNNGLNAYLASMTTDPALRGKGIGTALLDQAIQWCRDQQARSITLWATASGEAIYRRAGFREVDSPFQQLRMSLL